MTGVTDDYAGRVVETGSDVEMGRWSYTRMLGKNGRSIIIVSACQVCNQQANTTGNRTAFAQQLSLLRRNGKDCSPRKSFFDDINGADVHGFARISAKWDLVEIIQHHHRVTNKPPTYARGTRCLDYVFCTPNLLSSVMRRGILVPHSEVIDSKQRAIFVDFDTQTLMGGNLATLSATP
jgi:hypothetical protein